MPARLAQISDFHVTRPGALAYGRVDANAALAAAVRALNALDPQPDVVIGSGDLVQGGADAEYDALTAILEPLRAPFLPLPGNHDRREGMRRAFPAQGFGPDHLQRALDLGDLRVLTLDTLREGSDEPQLDAGRLAWLDRALADPRPTVVAMHHPPAPSGVGWVDPVDAAWSDALGARIAAAPQIVRILCGHGHRSLFRPWRGVALSMAPSTAHQVALDLRPAAAPAFALEAPGFHLHVWDGAELATYVASTLGFEDRFAPG
jgi:3',5'-cyclic AMP phosphodiesterase CpdA